MYLDISFMLLLLYHLEFMNHMVVTFCNFLTVPKFLRSWSFRFKAWCWRKLGFQETAWRKAGEFLTKWPWCQHCWWFASVFRRKATTTLWDQYWVSICLLTWCSRTHTLPEYNLPVFADFIFFISYFKLKHWNHSLITWHALP